MMTPTTELLAAAPDAIPSALVAYGHYLPFIIATSCVTAERLTIKPAMTMEEEKIMTLADSTYGLTSILLVYTGYLRVIRYWSRSIVLHMPSDVLRLHRLRTDQVLKAAAGVRACRAYESRRLKGSRPPCS